MHCFAPSACRNDIAAAEGRLEALLEEQDALIDRADYIGREAMVHLGRQILRARREVEAVKSKHERCERWRKEKVRRNEADIAEQSARRSPWAWLEEA